ncbi:hypothetical protein [Stieleria varia]|uniref:YcxB-like protein domain-containing protein n=1 Tax=Stieleria varia TaxID=2528005 RepID=A0A5C6B6W4_9BACT|nr:hypothetical protein [Stieleria varia]TWU07507.1 hypothetical protein Pla52n_00800 [Stieleria varia]
MNATARLVFDRAYYESHYDAWLRHRAKLRPYAVYLSLALLAFGVIMAFAFPAKWAFGALFACFGVYELVETLTHKSRWVNARVNATRENKTVDMKLSESELTTTSFVAHGTIQIVAFSKIIPATDGVFLIPDSGVSIYIPAATVEPSGAFRPLVDAWMAARSGR